MADPFRQPYLDSSVFFALIKQERISGVGGIARWEIAQRILGEAEAGRFLIFTSTATIAEVRRTRTQSEPLSHTELVQVQEFFQLSFIRTVDVTRDIAEKAQILGAEYNLTPIDAIHLATAINCGCDVMLVWDKRFSQQFEHVPTQGVRVAEPYWFS